MKAYDGRKTYGLQAGDYCIARKNHLLRYTKSRKEGEFLKIVVVLDTDFLKRFHEKHPVQITNPVTDEAIMIVQENKLLRNFIQSLEPYYSSTDELDPTFADVKREELLLILLKSYPGLSGVFFNFGAPEKIDLESFMLHNFRFNVSLERFAYLTGRSLSSFKREFQKLFNEQPGQWLTRKRLEDAYFRIRNEHTPPGEVYLETGFENFSHFSYAFKKRFGLTPSQVATAAADH